MDERYSRQILINQIGEAGQKKLSRSSVFVVGAGGLGSPVLTYLTVMGIGHLAFIDSDIAAESNLNRQFLHHTEDIGRKKTISALEKLNKLNNKIDIKAHNERLTDKNAQAFFNGYDIVIGAVDSFETRFVINKACVSLDIPYFDGGINGFSGIIMFSHPPNTPCLNCVFPKKKKTNEPVGVFGATAGVIGTILANCSALWLLGVPNPVENRLIMYDGLNMKIDHIDIKRDENCEVCR
ncbi:MAG: HesA/MoeB/ThiF family protein [Treponema sp.]|nr:HesA/MoeB/ThiF family protein [Treponema sp.]